MYQVYSTEARTELFLRTPRKTLEITPRIA